MAAALQTKRFVWGLIFLVVTAAGCFSYLAGVRYLAAVEAVEGALAVQSNIDETLSLYKDAETGQRGFILTGQEQFLEPYNDARAKLPDRMAALRRVLGRDPVQREHLAELERLARAKLEFMAGSIRTRREGDLTAPPGRIQIGPGKVLMDAMRAETRKMTEREQEVLRGRRHDAQTAKAAAAWSVVMGSALTALLALAGLLSVHRDLEELRRAGTELAVSEEHFRLLTENSNDLVRLLGLDGKTKYVSPSVERLLGYTREEYLALPGRSLVHPEEVALAASILEDVTQGRITRGVSTYRIRHRSGEYRLFEVRWSVMKDETGTMSIHTAGRDVTERQRSEEQLTALAEQLRSLSLRDELTQLYNRRGFLEVAAEVQARAGQSGRGGALVFVDLNGMKRINDGLGHDVGDQALKDAAHVLAEAFGTGDVVARLGGDEFAVFSVDFPREGLPALRERLRSLADEETQRNDRPYRLSMSVGAAFTDPASPRSLDDLLGRADTAMYEEKRARQAAGNVSIPPRRSVLSG